ncbi:MAG: DUF4157 domain-containing protein [Waterburya sp.]
MAKYSRYHRKLPSSPEKKSPFFDKDQTSQPFFSSIGKPPIQTKLTVGRPGDVFEQEADRMADRIVNHQSSPQVQQKADDLIQRQNMEQEEEMPVQEQAEKEEEEMPVQKQAEKEEEEMPVQAKANNSHSTGVSLSQQLNHTQGQGQPLPASTQAEMSNALGYNFSDVTIHTDAQSVRLNQDLRAQAFTHGKDIYFNEGKYDPESQSGKHLLAHELTHVVQQNAVSANATNLNSQPTIQRIIGGEKSLPQNHLDASSPELHRAQSHLRTTLSDDTIRYHEQWNPTPGVSIIEFRSERGYLIHYRFIHQGKQLVESAIDIIQSGERLTINEFLARQDKA